MAQPRFSFKVTILVVFAALTLTLSAAMLYLNYARNSKATLLAADNLLEQANARILSSIDRMIEPLTTLVDTVVLLPAVDAAAGDLEHPLAPIMIEGLERLPQMASVYLANGRGDFYRVIAFKGDRQSARASVKAPGNAMLATQRIRTDPDGRRDARWRYFDSDGGQTGIEVDPATPYDPRQRPWYIAAQKTPNSIVTDYYAFASVASIGLTVARRWGDANDNVFAADLTMSSVSQYLAEVRAQLLGKTHGAEIAILHRDGRLLAHSDRTSFERALSASANPRIPSVDEVGSGILGTILARQNDGDGPRQRSTDAKGKDWLARIAPLPAAFGDGAILVLAVPTADFLGPLGRTATETLVLSVLIVIGFLPIVYYLAGVISAPLGRVTKEIAAIRQFDLEPHPPIRSAIAEIQDLARTLTATKFMLGAFGKYVPKNLVRQIVDSEIEPKLGGQRIPLTVFFSDVRDFTTISEKVPPERLMEFMSDYLEGLVTIIMENRGTVDKFVGDQIMAYWNAPVPNPNHIADGAIALLRCCNWTNAKNAEWEHDGHPILYTRFALHEGDAIVGNVGSSDRMDYTVVGATINLGSRIEGLNKVYGTQVLITHPVASALDPKRFVLRPIDRVLPKGAVHPLDVYELKGVTTGDAEAIDLAVDAHTEALCDAWTGFYGRYLSRDWPAAEDALKRFTQRFGVDSVTRLYEKRLRTFRAAPPAADWDGVIRYSEK
jgi:adenylate cyclase